MYSEHPVFELPEREAKIWRYQDLAKLLHLLRSLRLFFARSDKLGDPFEGSYPIANRQHRDEWYAAANASREASGLGDLREVMPTIFRRNRERTFISCWHLNEGESAAMWELYGRSNIATAIQSSVGRLVDSFAGYGRTVFIGRVRYIDYDNTPLSEGNAFTPFVTKRKSYEHENELRAIVNAEPYERRALASDGSLVDSGVYVPVDLKTLVDTVFVAPNAPDWFTDVVTTELFLHGFSRTAVRRSKIGEDPFF